MFKNFSKLNLLSGKTLSKSDLLNFKGGVEAPGGGGGGTPPGDDDGGQSVTHLEYCAQLYAIISCNPGQTTYYFNANGCNNGTNGERYWGSAVSQGIPMNGNCNVCWYQC